MPHKKTPGDKGIPVSVKPLSYIEDRIKSALRHAKHTFPIGATTRYEDLIDNTDKAFLNILKFIAHLGRVNFTLDEKKFENSLKTIEIKKMSNNESKKFDQINTKTKVTLEKELENELKELNYL